MNSLTSGPSTLYGATVQTAEGNEFINAGRDTIKITVQNIIDRRTAPTPEPGQTSGENVILEDNKDVSGPVGNFVDIYSAISTVLAMIFGRRRVHTPMPVVDDTTRSNSCNLLPQEVFTDCAPEPAAIVSDILAHDSYSFSSMPNISTERYTRSMLNCQCTAGYPLYEPRPDCEPLTEYWKKGVRIGDVGIVTEDGIFDFIFNVCPSQNPSINPSELPDGFETLEYPEIRVREQHFKTQTHLFNNAVNRIEEPDARYKCSGTEGAILELPAGATLFEAKNKLPFKTLASRHAENWYRYAVVTRGRDVPNGSLYLVTSCIKCTHWGIAVFDRPSSSQDRLQFVENKVSTSKRSLNSKYDWKGSGAFIAKVAMDSDIPDLSDDDNLNQCIFLRGYKIMLRKDVWESAIDPHSTSTSFITTPSPSSGPGSKRAGQRDLRNRNDHLDRGGSDSSGGTSRRPAQNTYEYGTRPMTLPATSSQMEVERVIIQADFHTPSLHPSDLINAALLSQELDAKVALTHDDNWWDLLQEYENFGKIVSSYTSTIDDHGTVSLEILGDHCGSDNIPSTSATHGSSRKRKRSEGEIPRRRPTSPYKRKKSLRKTDTTKKSTFNRASSCEL